MFKKIFQPKRSNAKVTIPRNEEPTSNVKSSGIVVHDAPVPIALDEVPQSFPSPVRDFREESSNEGVISPPLEDDIQPPLGGPSPLLESASTSLPPIPSPISPFQPSNSASTMPYNMPPSSAADQTPPQRQYTNIRLFTPPEIRSVTIPGKKKEEAAATNSHQATSSLEPSLGISHGSNEDAATEEESIGPALRLRTGAGHGQEIDGEVPMTATSGPLEDSPAF